MRAFEVLLNLLISIINTLNKDGYNLYDSENRDYYISSITYCEVDNKLIVNYKEDK